MDMISRDRSIKTQKELFTKAENEGMEPRGK
jgi:hypothetical protein